MAPKAKTKVKRKKTKKAMKKAGSATALSYEINEVRVGQQTIRFQDITKVHPVLKNYFCYCLNKVALRKKTLLEKALSELKIQGLHFGTLKLIGNIDQVNQLQVGEEMGIDKASMVKVFDYLEGQKLIERKKSAQDRRVNLLNITEKGRRTLHRARKICERTEKEFLKPLSPSEAQTLKELLLRLLNE
jgi:DNA-binding MarR family transcriptional regulator